MPIIVLTNVDRRTQHQLNHDLAGLDRPSQPADLRRWHLQYSSFPQGTGDGPNATRSRSRPSSGSNRPEPNGAIKHQLQYTQTVLLNFNGLAGRT